MGVPDPAELVSWQEVMPGTYPQIKGHVSTQDKMPTYKPGREVAQDTSPALEQPAS